MNSRVGQGEGCCESLEISAKKEPARGGLNVGVSVQVAQRRHPLPFSLREAVPAPGGIAAFTTSLWIKVARSAG
jgi:hypothetical protein